VPKPVGWSQNFRSDIQGLRGIAVLLVVIYHTGLALPGGYIGVDIFFVISGFVITQLLLREVEATGRISLVSFYSRRIKRILPAVSFAIVGTLLISVFALSPFGEQRQVAETARASTLFAANFYFFLQNSYWALAENPLRHLWSLAVEEQFYLVFPAMILIFLRLKLGLRSLAVVLVLAVVAIGSFFTAYFLSHGNQWTPKPELFAFFGTPWRMWQFLAGTFVAIAPPPKESLRGKSVAICALSVLAIILGAMTFDSYTPFPGSAALVPVVGTSVLIYFGNTQNFVAQAISMRPLVAAGDVSYSWYLWHWPLIVFAHRVFPASETLAPIIAALLALPFAVFSLRVIENPIRYNESIQGDRVVKLGVLCAVAPIIFSFGVQRLAETGLGLTELRNDNSIRTSYADKRQCRIDLAANEPETDCIQNFFGPNAKRVLLVGDSAAGSLSDGLAAATTRLELNFSVFYANSCPFTRKPYEYRENCAENFLQIQEQIRTIDPDVLVIANMSDLFVSEAGLGKTIVDFDGNPARDIKEAIRFWLAGLSARIESESKNRDVLLIQQPPLSAMSEPVLLQRLFDEEISLDNSDTRNMIVAAEADLFKKYANVAVFDPATVLCDGQNCRQTLNGGALYYDGRHLTVKGSLLMVDGIVAKLKSLIERER